MTTTQQRALIQRANVLFPLTAYTDDAAVRHARREWLRKVTYLRTQATVAWVYDLPVIQHVK